MFGTILSNVWRRTAWRRGQFSGMLACRAQPACAVRDLSEVDHRPWRNQTDSNLSLEKHMNRNMYDWAQHQCHDAEKFAIPVLAFPGIKFTGKTVAEAVQSSEDLSDIMAAVAQRTKASASVSVMDLSVEAEAFGAPVKLREWEVPQQLDVVVRTQEDADALAIPEIGSARTGIFIDAINKATRKITDRPIFGGFLGTFSLAGNLMEMTDIMKAVRKNPKLLHTVMEKITEFHIEYCRAYKKAGADGMLIAEPLAGLLSPAQSEEFSCRYLKRLVKELQTDDFIFIYHNCGNATITMVNELLDIGCPGYHFGNAINMKDMLKVFPSDVCCMGNVDPTNYFVLGQPEDIYTNTMNLMKECCPTYRNFVISSGCDIPVAAKWENVEAFFKAVDDYYGR